LTSRKARKPSSCRSFPAANAWSARKASEKNMCLNPKFLASTCDGLARTLLTYPAKRLIPIPEKVDLRAAALAEPISVALNAIESAGLREGENVAIIGDGTIAYILAIVLNHVANVSKQSLHVFGIVDEKLELFSDFAYVVNTLKNPEASREMRDNFDIVFEAVGGKAQEKTLDQALDLLIPSGKAVILGIPAEEKVPLKTQKIIRKCLTIKGSF